MQAALCKTHPALCGDEGLALIRKDIADEGVDHRDAGGVLRAGQAEGVRLRRAPRSTGSTCARAWPGSAARTTRTPSCWPRTTCAWARAQGRRLQPAGALQPRASSPRSILVVGGGVAGMTAALEAAKAGYEVHAGGEGGELGGFAAKLHQIASPPAALPGAGGRRAWTALIGGRVARQDHGAHPAPRSTRSTARPASSRWTSTPGGKEVAAQGRRDRAGHRLRALRRRPSWAPGLRPVRRTW